MNELTKPNAAAQGDSGDAAKTPTAGMDDACEMCLDLIPLVRDGAASEASRAWVRAHTAGCESCWEALAQSAPPTPAPTPDEALLRKRIQAGIIARLALFLLVGLFFGLNLSLAVGFEYNLVFLPAIGLLARLFCGRMWYWAPIVVAVSNAISQIITAPMGHYSPPLLVLGGLLLGAVCGGLCLAGAGIANLLKMAFGRRQQEASEDKPKNRRVLAGVGGILLPLLLVVGCACASGFGVLAQLSRLRVESALRATYPGVDLRVDNAGGYTQWNNSLYRFYHVSLPSHPEGLGTVETAWGGVLIGDVGNVAAAIVSSLLTREMETRAWAALESSDLAGEVGVWLAYLKNYPYGPDAFKLLDDPFATVAQAGDDASAEVTISLVTSNADTSEATARQILKRVNAVMKANGLPFDTYEIVIYQNAAGRFSPDTPLHYPGESRHYQMRADELE